MNRGYLYLVFISLSSVVVLGIALVFQLSTTTQATVINTSIIDNETEQLRSLMEVQNFNNSWLYKLSSEKNQRAYLYPTQKFHIEFN